MPIETHPDVIIPSAGHSSYEFGSALAAFGDELLVAATFRDYFGYAEGDVAPPRCCLLSRDGGNWARKQTLSPSAGTVADGFGRRVALGASFAIVGNAGHENGDGPVHDFTRSGTGSFKLHALVDSPESRASTADVFGEYGAALACDGRVLAVGAGIESEWRDGESACEFGGVIYLFDHVSPGEPVATLRGDVPHENFGSALALSGDWLVVGAPGHGSNEQLAGAVIVCERDTAGHFRKLYRIEGRRPGELFGAQVALDGSLLAVSAPGRPDLARPTGSGRVDLFELGQNSYRLVASIQQEPGFGAALALCGNRLAIGEPTYTEAASSEQTGRVALYRVGLKQQPILEAWLSSPGSMAHASLGSALALGPSYVAAGAPGLGVTTPDQGFVAIKDW